MQPDDVVNLPMTRMEIARVHAALSALVTLHEMMGDRVPSAVNLVDAVEVIQGILPRMRAEFPSEADVTVEVQKADAKTYQQDKPFDLKVRDVSPEAATKVFPTQYDEAIRELYRSLIEFTDYTPEDFGRLLDENKALLVKTMGSLNGLTVAKAGPFVEASDLITLGSLAHAMYLRQDQIEDTSKPF